MENGEIKVAKKRRKSTIKKGKIKTMPGTIREKKSRKLGIQPLL
jgi:hypothetical protein